MTSAASRLALVRRGRWLSWATLAYNCLEGSIALTAGVIAGSIALVGFGADSLIELAASVFALWRLGADVDAERRERVERLSHRGIGILFLALAVYVVYESATSLARSAAPESSRVGIVLAAVSVVVMPALARAKRRVATGLSSRALEAEATQTSLCAWLSAILLGGLALNAIAGWWWADPLAALVMVPIIAREGFEGVRGEHHCDDCR